MKCPGCGAALNPRSAEGLSLHRCDGCGGLWIDNEAGLLVSRGELSEAARALVLSVEREAPAEGESERTAARPCPECGEGMPEVTVPHTEVRVDVCAAHGTYFDRSELASAYQAIEIKNTVDDEAADAFGREIAGDRAEEALRGSLLGRLLGWLRP